MLLMTALNSIGLQWRAYNANNFIMQSIAGNVVSGSGIPYIYTLTKEE